MKKNVYFNEFNVQMGDTLYLPYVSGLLQASAQANPEIAAAYEFKPFLFVREGLDALLARYDEPDVAAFSVSLWNEQYSLAAAERVKARYPGCLIVFGGPQVPEQSEEYLARHGFIDVAARGDGEQTFAAILKRRLRPGGLDGVANVTWRSPEGGRIVRSTASAATVEDLDAFPSPYLEGTFDSLVKRGGPLKYQAIVETNRGCPYSCSYCVWGKGESKKRLRFHGLERVKAEIEWFAKNGIVYLFNADSNFGIVERDVEITEALAAAKARYGAPDKFRTCFAKNADQRLHGIALKLHAANLSKGITLSFQSVDEEVIRNVKRQNIKMSAYKDLCVRFNRSGIPVYTELILGLPGETYRSWLTGLEYILGSELTGQLFIYNCEVYQNTDLGDPGYAAKYGLKTRRLQLAEVHGAVKDPEIQEYIDIVVASDSMPGEDWRKMMKVSYLVLVLFSLKLGFFVLRYLRSRFGLKYTDIVTGMMEGAAAGGFDELKEELRWYDAHLDGILAGGKKSVAMPGYGDIYWDVEEASYLRLGERRERFFGQMEVYFERLLEGRPGFDREEFREVMRYQRLKVPGFVAAARAEAGFEYNIPEYFEASLKSQAVPLCRKKQTLALAPRDYAGDKAAFAREVLLWGRKSNNLFVESSWSGAGPALPAAAGEKL